MSHQVCHDVTEWITENVQQPVQRCIEQDCNWWCLCCNKWFCFIVWVIVTVGSWVTHAVCELVADVVDVVVAVVIGVVNILIGIVTWNWARVWDAFLNIVTTVVQLVVDAFRVLTGGDLVGFFRDAVDAWVLIDYVRDLVSSNKAYTDDQRARIKDALGIDGGGFGLRLRGSAVRCFVRSDSVSDESGIPDLVRWHNDPNPATQVDLKILAGVNWTGFWQRSRPEVIPDSGAIVPIDFDAYLQNPAAARQFSIFSMSSSVLDDKLSTASVKAENLGLKLRFVQQTTQLTSANQVRIAPSDAALVQVLRAPPFGRADELTDPVGAQRDLCAPVLIGTFLFVDNSFRGYSAHLHPSRCFDDANRTTGAAFRDNVPDIVWKYVPIHELGHTFGLCHVDGIDHIMYGPKDQSWFDWTTIPQYLWLGGEPRFTLDEAKATWDYIIANFSADCLATRQF